MGCRHPLRMSVSCRLHRRCVQWSLTCVSSFMTIVCRCYHCSHHPRVWSIIFIVTVFICARCRLRHRHQSNQDHHSCMCVCVRVCVCVYVCVSVCADVRCHCRHLSCLSVLVSSSPSPLPSVCVSNATTTASTSLCGVHGWCMVIWMVHGWCMVVMDGAWMVGMDGAWMVAMLPLMPPTTCAIHGRVYVVRALTMPIPTTPLMFTGCNRR